MANVPTKILKVAGKFGSYGEDGATFTPSVSEDGELSWTNNRGLDNPAPVNITGKQGEPGAKGDPGTPPHIGENGNWWIGETDTGVAAGGGTALPEVTTADNDKILQVVDGVWTAVAMTDVSEVGL